MPLFLIFIAISQILGALFLLVVIVQNSSQLATFDTAQQLRLAASAVPYLLGILGGALILMRYRLGIWLSLVHQICAIPLVVSSSFAYLFHDGVIIAFGHDVSPFGARYFIDFWLGAGLMQRLSRGGSYYGVNAFALICALYLALHLYSLLRRGRPAQMRLLSILRAIGILQPNAESQLSLTAENEKDEYSPPLFLTIIGILQFFGALLFFQALQAFLKQTHQPVFSALTFQGGTFFMYFAGFIGGALIWTRPRLGIGLSLIHQILFIPLFIIPGVYFYVLDDAIGLALTIEQTQTDAHIVYAFSFGLGLLQLLNPTPGASYYGVNGIALICTIYLALQLYWFRRRMRPAQTTAEPSNQSETGRAAQ